MNLLARTQVRIAQRYGLGGSSWAVYRPSGNRVTGATSSSSVGTKTAYVRRVSHDKLESAAPQVLVGGASYLVYAAADVDIQIDDTLISAADATLIFLVKDVSTDRGLLIGIVERQP